MPDGLPLKPVQVEHLLYELWKVALFDDDAYRLLEEVARQVTACSSELSGNADLLNRILNKLATYRNCHLINNEEQEKLRQTVVGFFGLSVGSQATLTWIMQARPAVVRIVDPDTVDATNLNRIRFGVRAIGQSKAKLVKEEIREISPTTKVLATTRTDYSAVVGCFTDPGLNIVVDEIDDLQGKFWLRQLARYYQLPLISGTDLGDNVIVDVERYDLEPELEPFLGRIPEIKTVDFETLTPRQKLDLIIRLVGFEHCSEQMLESLLSIGKTLPTWPQLGATATIAGGVLTTTVKKLVLGEEVPSGRYPVSLDSILVPNFNSAGRVTKREELARRLLMRDKAGYDESST